MNTLFLLIFNAPLSVSSKEIKVTMKRFGCGLLLNMSLLTWHMAYCVLRYSNADTSEVTKEALSFGLILPQKPLLHV